MDAFATRSARRRRRAGGADKTSTGGERMEKLALLGDSIFDNKSYVAPGEHDVIAQLKRALPAGWTATLLARDGSTMSDIPDQLALVSADTTQLVVSIGGNDALGYSAVLGERSQSMAESLSKLAAIQAEFRTRYARMLDAVRARQLPAVCCTIYDPRYTNPAERRIATTALSVLNDGIIREAALRGIPLLDLRAICSADADFANPIEPSATGGEKISSAIARFVTEGGFAAKRAIIFTG
jgi:lysophospholipase L1-like esterase